MQPGQHAATGGSGDALGRELADMKRRIADLARSRQSTLIALATKTANVTVTTTLADLTDYTVTFSGIAGRRYKVTGSLYMTVDSGSTATRMRVTLTDSSNNVLQIVGQCESVSGTLPFDSIQTRPYFGTFTGSTTLKLRAQITAGDGTAAVNASATAPGYLFVEDVGVA